MKAHSLLFLLEEISLRYECTHHFKKVLRRGKNETNNVYDLTHNDVISLGM